MPSALAFRTSPKQSGRACAFFKDRSAGMRDARKPGRKVYPARWARGLFGPFRPSIVFAGGCAGPSARPFRLTATLGRIGCLKRTSGGTLLSSTPTPLPFPTGPSGWGRTHALTGLSPPASHSRYFMVGGVGKGRGAARSTNPQRRVKGHHTRKARPTRFRLGTVPQKRLSLLFSLLSPNMK